MSHGIASRIAAYRGKYLKRLGSVEKGTTGFEPATSDGQGGCHFPAVAVTASQDPILEQAYFCLS
jgi:hypothetical protein